MHRFVNHHHKIIFKKFSFPLKETPYPSVATLYFPASCSIPKQPLIYFMSLYICPLWTLHINGIM